MHALLRSTERSAESILEDLPTPILGITRDGHLQFINKACEHVCCISREGLIGQHVSGRILPPGEWERFRKAFPAPGDDTVTTTCEVAVRSASGPERHIKWHMRALNGGDDELILCSGVDTSDRRRMEHQLTRTEKLSALGQLVAGVAHELNNPLTGVIGFSQVLGSRPDCPPQVKNDLDLVVQNAKRCKSVVDNLLAFARQGRPERKPVGINALLDTTLDLMSYHFKTASVKAAREYIGMLPPVMGDTNELQQVFVNIFSNAIHAISSVESAGTVTVKTHRMGKRVHIEISDDGPGMPPEVLERVFDPFYTTKPVGEGTGLGLSVCYGIVSGHEGQIRAESAPGEGSTFIIELPACDEARVVPRPRTTDSQMLRLRQKILVIDDEEVVLSVLSRILPDLGFRVTTASSVDEAKALIERNRFDMIMCDLKMPGLGGRGLYDWLVEHHPDLAPRMVFCTGDTVSDDWVSLSREIDAPVVLKPFNVSDLARALAEVQYQNLDPGGRNGHAPGSAD